ncbi:MAG: hypothetical protein U0996_25425 [Planctomycetaceae bacterium]
MNTDRRTPAAVVVGTGFVDLCVEGLRVPVCLSLAIVGSSPEKSRNATASDYLGAMNL